LAQRAKGSHKGFTLKSETTITTIEPSKRSGLIGRSKEEGLVVTGDREAPGGRLGSVELSSGDAKRVAGSVETPNTDSDASGRETFEAIETPPETGSK
jgi:hypothetical protein